MRATTVKGVMTTSVVAVREEADFKEMVAALRTRRISALPVLDDANRVIGLVSEADLLFKEAGPALAHGLGRLTRMPKERAKAAGITAVEVMTSPAVTIGADAPVAEAAALMQSRRVKRLPVVDADGRLRGIVSRADVLTVFERPDHEIWDEVVKGVIVGEFRLDPEMFVVTVRSGVVTVTGSVDRRSGALEMLAAIRHLEGVVALRDRLSYPAV
jgi:CBS domain-containing protein